MREQRGAEIIKRGEKPLIHQRQEQTVLRVKGACVRGVEVSSMRKKMEIALGVKANTNIYVFSFFFPSVEYKKGSLKETQGASGNMVGSDC